MIAAMLRRYGWILIALALFAAWQWWQGAPPALPPAGDAPPVATLPSGAGDSIDGPDARQADTAALPREAYATLQRILDDAPHPYRQDGGTFQNRERLLPRRDRGWYREYTVATPGSRDRGARRIVTGGGIPGRSRPSEFWYTDDHYRSFRRIDAAVERAR
jgi:ribonuclease T1